MGNPIRVTVSGTPTAATYNSDSNKVAANGDITINPGTTTIYFLKDATWSYQAPWITFDDPGPFNVSGFGPYEIEIEDTDPGGGRDRHIEYTLHTTAGNFDPKIINKGTG